MAVEIRDRRERGWWWVDNALLDRYGARLGPIGLAVYCVLARYADGEGRSFPGVPRIAELTGVSVRTVQRHLPVLERLGLLRVEGRRSEAGGPEANVYVLLRVVGQEGGGDSVTPGVVSESHQGGDSVTPGVVSESHPKKTHGEEDLLKKGEPPAPAPARGEDEGAGEAETFRLRAVRVLNEAESVLFAFFGSLPTSRQAEQLRSTLELHLKAGRAPTLEQWERACRGAGVWADRKNNGRRTAGALLQELGQVLQAVDRPETRQRRREEQLSRASLERDAAQERSRRQAVRFGDGRAEALWRTLAGAQDPAARGFLAGVTAVRVAGDVLVCEVGQRTALDWLARRAGRMAEAARESVREFPDVEFRLEKGASQGGSQKGGERV